MGRTYARKPVKSKGAASRVLVHVDEKRRLKMVALENPALPLKRKGIGALDQSLLRLGEDIFKAKGRNLGDLADRPGKKSVRARVQVTRAGKPAAMVLGRGGFKTNYLGEEVLSGFSEKSMRAGVRGQRSDRRKGRIDRRIAHNLGSGASILQVGQFLLVPQRSRKVARLKGKVHVIAGRVREGEQTHQVARREVAEETGIPEKELAFVGRGGGKQKTPKPHLVTQEVRETAGFDFLYRMKAGKNALRKYFRKNKDGSYRTLGAQDAWEASRWHKVKNSKRAIERFLEKEGENISPTAHVVLTAHLKGLGG